MLRTIIISIFIFFSTFLAAQEKYAFFYSNKHSYVSEYKIKNKILPESYEHEKTTFKLTPSKMTMWFPGNSMKEFDIISSEVYDDHVVIQSFSNGYYIYFCIYENFISVGISGDNGLWIYVLNGNTY